MDYKCELFFICDFKFFFFLEFKSEFYFFIIWDELSVNFFFEVKIFHIVVLINYCCEIN